MGWGLLFRQLRIRFELFILKCSKIEVVNGIFNFDFWVYFRLMICFYIYFQMFFMWILKREFFIFFNMILIFKFFGVRWFFKILFCDVFLDVLKVQVIVDCIDKYLTDIFGGIFINVINFIFIINYILGIFLVFFYQLENLVEIDFRCNCVFVRLGLKDNVCKNRLQIKFRSFSRFINLKFFYLDGNQFLEIFQDFFFSLQLLSFEVNNIFLIMKKNLIELVNIEMFYLG